MSAFRRCFRAERIKWRRDWTILTSLLAPSTQVGVLLLIVWFSEDRATLLGSGFPAWYKINYLVWNLVTMPITIALISALSWELEEKSRIWSHLLIQPVPRRVHYFAKLASHLSLFLMAQLLLALLLIMGGLLLQANVPALGMGAPDLSLLRHYIGFSMLASLPVLCLHAWFPLRFPSLGASLAMALGGSWISLQLASRWPMNALLPWGLAAQIADIALRAKTPPQSLYLASFVFALVLAALGVFDFGRHTEAMDRRG